MNSLLPRPTPSVLVEQFLSGRSPRTIEAYGRDLALFAAFVGATSVQDAAERLLADQATANLMTLAWFNSMFDEGLPRGHGKNRVLRALSPQTANRRMAALTSLVKLARTLGFVPWTLDAPRARAKSFRDTRGPGWELPNEAIEAATPRDAAILSLLLHAGLRRGEVASLDVCHLDLAGRRVALLGKGCRERAWHTIPDRAAALLDAWLRLRGEEPGSLFGLSGWQIWELCRGYGFRPHGCRHALATRIAKKTKDVSAVQGVLRHGSRSTSLAYIDADEDVVGRTLRAVVDGG